MTTFNTTSSEFTDYGAFHLGKMGGGAEGGFGTFFSQINDTTLFTISPQGDCIHAYNLEEVSFQRLDTTIPVNVGPTACLASSNVGGSRLYIAGGGTWHTGWNNDLQVLDLDSMEWIDGVPPMKYRYLVLWRQTTCSMFVHF